MKILAISDTHGVIYKAEKVIKSINGINLIIHLGDYIRDAHRLSNIFPEIPIECTLGNCDYAASDTPLDKVLEYNGIRILVTHGHRYSVKCDYDKLYRKAEEAGAHLVLFGHTHIADITMKNGVYLVNPGSISFPRNNCSESYAIIELNDERIRPELFSIKMAEW